jgi:peroxiredoxin
MHPISLRPKPWAVIFALLTIGFSAALGAAAAEKGLAPLAESRAAPDFELPGVDGRPHRLDAYRGRYLLVSFWAVWCAPCMKEMPSMERAYNELKGDRFELLAVHVGPSLEDAKKFADEHHLTFPVLVDESMNLGVWQVLGVPTTYLVDPQGQIVAEAVGDREWDSPQMIEALRGYLSGSPP